MGYWSTAISGVAVSHGPVEGGYVIRLNYQDMAWAASQPAGAQFSFWSTSSVRFDSDPSQYVPEISGGAQILDYTISKTWVEPTPPTPTTYTVSCNTDGHGSLSASPSSGASGTTVTLNAVALSGYVFDHYSASPSTTIGSNNKFTLTQNVSITAYFRRVYTNVTAGDYITDTDRSQTGAVTTKGEPISDTHFSPGEPAEASTFNSRVLN